MRRVLALLGDYYHCSDQLAMAVTETVRAANGSIDMRRYPDTPEASVLREALGEIDVLLLATMGRLRPRTSQELWLDEDTESAIDAFVRSGGGLLALHAGTASHRTDGPLRALVGGHFVHHPPQRPPVTVSVVGRHPVTAGVATFTHPDEHYFMEVDDDVTPLLETTSELGSDCGGWCREAGSGRVVVIVPGHTREMLEEPGLARLLRNALTWLRREEVV